MKKTQSFRVHIIFMLLPFTLIANAADAIYFAKLPGNSSMDKPADGRDVAKGATGAEPSQDNITVREMEYKKIGDQALKMNIYLPGGHAKSKKSPAIVFFFGGGWYGGSIDHFKRQSEYFARKGYVCFTPQYRTKKSHGVLPFKCVEDAKSAMRWVRLHAADYGIDPEKIVAGGGSAGGHLAAAVAYVDKYDAPEDKLEISPKPCALLLFNPVIDNGPGGYGYERIGDEYKDFSPLHNIKKPVVPALFMLGTKDKLIPVKVGKEFKKKTEDLGEKCELILYEGQGHGFFNNKEYFDKTVAAAEKFLAEIGIAP